MDQLQINCEVPEFLILPTWVIINTGAHFVKYHYFLRKIIILSKFSRKSLFKLILKSDRLYTDIFLTNI